MRASGCVALIVSGILAALTPARAEGVQVAPDNRYVGIAFGKGDPPELVIFAGLEEVGGKLAVCGLVILNTTTNSLKRAEPQITRQVRYTLGGKRLPVQTAMFKRYKSAAEAKGGKAGCSVTKLPWKPAYATTPLEMSAGQITYTDQF